jgi:hypothetical protein
MMDILDEEQYEEEESCEEQDVEMVGSVFLTGPDLIA